MPCAPIPTPAEVVAPEGEMASPHAAPASAESSREGAPSLKKQLEATQAELALERERSSQLANTVAALHSQLSRLVLTATGGSTHGGIGCGAGMGAMGTPHAPGGFDKVVEGMRELQQFLQQQHQQPYMQAYAHPALAQGGAGAL